MPCTTKSTNPYLPATPSSITPGPNTKGISLKSGAQSCRIGTSTKICKVLGMHPWMLSRDQCLSKGRLHLQLRWLNKVWLISRLDYSKCAKKSNKLRKNSVNLKTAEGRCELAMNKRRVLESFQRLNLTNMPLLHYI